VTDEKSPSDVPSQALVPTDGKSAAGPYSSRWSLGGAPEDAGSQAGAELARYLGAIRRFKWLILGATLVGLAGGVFQARRARPVYESEITLWIESPPDRYSQASGPITQNQILSSTGWVSLLKSYVVLDDAVSKMKLYLFRSGGDSTLWGGFSLRERFRPGAYRLAVDKTGKVVTLSTDDGTVVQRAAPGDSLGQSVGFDWGPPAAALPPGLTVDFGVNVPRDAAASLGDRLRIASDARGNFLSVTLTGTNPNVLAGTLNAVADRFVQVADELKRNKLVELSGTLNDQLRQAEQTLKQSEAALQSFRVQTVTLPSDAASPVAPGLAATEDPVFKNYFDMKVAQDQLRQDRDAIGRALSQAADSGLSTDALEIIGSVQKSSDLMNALKELTDRRAELRALRYRYTDQSPPVRDLAAVIDTLERRSIPALARSLMSDLSVRARELDRRLASASRELQQIPARAIQEARLKRDVDIAGALYTTLQQRFQEARLADASSVPDVRVLDKAVAPDRPIKNRRRDLLLMGLFVGMGAGLGGALLLERLDRRLRYPTQVTAGMGLPILGVIPHLAGKNGARSLDAQPVIEAVRGVRLNLGHAYGTAGPLVVTVSSPAPGDGKSFLCANLALSFAHAGHRALLIDGDTRRGSLHRVMRGTRKPGLTDVLAGRTAVEAAVQATEHARLFFLGCGSRMNDAPELLSSAALPQLLASLRSQYGVLVVDSPPLNAGVDASALGTVTGNLVLVMRTGQTDRQLAEAKLEMLDRLPIRILGAVLNGVKEGGAYRYYSYYVPGYEAEDEGRGTTEPKLLGGGVS
jgi:succinoglycan biosynthesis transport protein ExoP